MAIETNKSLVQFGYAVNKDASTAAGFITFDSGKQAIYVGDGTEAKLVTPSIKNVEFNNELKVLTITKLDGNTQTLDFSDVASAEGVNSLLATLRTDINKNAADINDVSTRVNNLDTSYQAADASLQEAINLKADASTAALKSDVSALSSKFDTSYGELTAADTSLRNDISALQQAVGTDGTVASMIDKAIEALDSSKASTGGDYVAVDVSIVNGKLAEVKVNDSSLSDTVSKAASAIQTVEKDESNSNAEERFVELLVHQTDNKVELSLNDTSLNEKIDEIDETINGLFKTVEGGVHFRGVYPSLPVLKYVQTEDYNGIIGTITVGGEEWEYEFDRGDIIIVSNSATPGDENNSSANEPTKEYILNVDDSPENSGHWVELGDLNPSTEAIAALEKKHDEQVKAINEYTVNGKAISGNPVLAGSDVLLTGYTEQTASALTAADSINVALGKLEARVDAAAASGVQSIGGEAGNITLRGGLENNGDVNLTISDKEIQASIVGLKSAAFTDATDYATAAQGAKADTAIQGVTAETPELNNTDYVAVHATEDETTHEVTLSSSVKVQAVESAGDNAKGLAEASDVKAYVDSQITAAALRWIVL